MPSIAAHMICAKLVAEKLNINDPEFIKGNLLPDIVDIENSHRKIKGKYYYIPNIDLIEKNIDLSDNLQLGYLTHLLLDKYFLEDYIYEQVEGKEVFLSRIMYKEYDIINYRLIEKFNIDKNYLNTILKDYKVPINTKKYETNIKCLNIVDTKSKLKYLSVDSFSNFLIKSSSDISKYLKEVKIKWI